jgi:hypothetical protein
VKLPYGVEDVLKLSQAQVSEDIVLSYIHNSGTIYSLNPNDIVYLRNQGVSDRIIGAMLDQRKAVEAASQASIAAAASAAAMAPPPQPMYAPTYSEPEASQPMSDTDSSGGSSVYVIQSPAVASAYYGSYYSPGYYSGGYPYYGYGSYGYPAVSFGFVIGSHGHFHGGGGHYHGYYHGASHAGGFHH